MIGWVTLSWAVVGAVPVQGELLDAGGAPLSGTHALRFELVDVADGSVDHDATVSASVVGGAFSVALSVDSSVFHAANLAMRVSVDGGAPSALVPLGVAPYAASAVHARQADALGALSPSDVLPRTDAAATYLSQANAATTYLSAAAATSTYLSQANATATYLSQANATATYLAKSDATSSYLSKSDATATYLAQTAATATYLSKSDATATYLSQSAAASTYANQAGLQRIDLMNVHPNGAGSGFFSISNNSDGGTTTWAPTSDTTLIINGNSCGGSHGGNWGHQIWLEPGTYKIVGQIMPLTTHTCIHGNTPTTSYTFTLQARWNVGSGSVTVIRDTTTEANTWIPFEGAPFTVATAGFVQPTYNTNGYTGIKASYIRGLSILRLSR